MLSFENTEMKLTKQDSDAPRMHAIEIERGIKKTVGIECV